MPDLVQIIKRTFEREFWPVAGKFDFIVLEVSEARESRDLRVARPGVYVWTDGQRVVKVGRHLTNARKRALEHLQDNTGQTMAGLDAMLDARLILFTLDPRDAYWAASLEMYLETELKPSVPSKRMG